MRMMPNYITALILIFSHSLHVFGGEGIITTLEAPLMSEPNMRSHVRQLFRKGQHIYIHERHFKNGPLAVSYDQDATTGFFPIKNNSDGEAFYQTKDRNGQTAYISNRYVKLITNDIREFSQNITPYHPDPNDYRIEEPLPGNYPFIHKNMYRAAFNFSVGPNLKSAYNYNSILEYENFSNNYGFDIRYSRKARWDKKNRFYFGGMLRGWTSKSSFTLYDDNRSATEKKSQLGLGTFISYDTWRDENMTITFSGGLLLNIDRNLVTQTGPTFEEQRLFIGNTITPIFSTYAQFNTAIPHFSIIAGVQTQINLPHSLKSARTPRFTYVWRNYGSSQDRVNISFNAQWSAVLGIQSDY